MKIILITMVIAVVLGGGAYYDFFYLPPVYSKAVLNVIKKFETTEKDLPRPESASNVTDKIVAIKQQNDFFRKIKKEIMLLRPPFFGKLRQFNEDIFALIDAQLGMYSVYGEKVNFFGGILDTQTIFKNHNLDEKTATIKDIQKHFEEAIPKAQTQIDALFDKEPDFAFKEITFAQLKSAWQEAGPGLDVWLGFIKRIDPNQPLGENVPSINPTKTEQDALQKVNTFFELVKKSAENNIPLSDLSPSFNQENQGREQRINEIIRELKETYGQ